VYHQECFVIHDIYTQTQMVICTMSPPSKKVKKYSYPCNRPWRPIGLWGVKNSTLCRQSAQMAVRLSVLRTSSDLLPRNINFLLLVLISVIGWVNPRALGGMKDYVNWTCIHLTGSRTRDLPARSIELYLLRYSVPQCVSVCTVTKISSIIKKGINNFLYNVSKSLVHAGCITSI
jgi:hypothetical protein